MVLGTVIKISTIGATLAGVVLFLTRAAQVGLGPAGKEVAEALQSLGTGVGSIGGGINALLTGIGTGSARLFDPLFTLKTLIYGEGNQGTVSVNPQTIAVVGESVNTVPTGHTSLFKGSLGGSVINRKSLTGGFLTQSKL